MFTVELWTAGWRGVLVVIQLLQISHKADLSHWSFVAVVEGQSNRLVLITVHCSRPCSIFVPIKFISVLWMIPIGLRFIDCWLSKPRSTTFKPNIILLVNIVFIYLQNGLAKICYVNYYWNKCFNNAKTNTKWMYV